jgi:outer membrane protein
VNIPLCPRLDFHPRYTYLSDVPPPSFVDAFPDPELQRGFDTQHHTGAFAARLSYPVSTIFFSIIPNHKAALKSAEAVKLQEHIQKLEVELQARESYFNYARARAALYVALSAQAQAEAHQRDVTALVNAGSLARVELMRADSQVALARVTVSRTRALVATVRALLFTLMHHDGTDDLTLSDNFEEVLPPLTETSDAILAKALSKRTELRQLRTTLEALEHTVDAAQGQQLPVLALGAQADYANPNQRYFGAAHEWNESWALFAALSWSPNDWATYGKTAEQGRADIAQTLADLERLEDGLRVEVARAFEDYNSAQASLVSARIGIAAADESYRVRREQFRAGAAVATDVIDAEGELRSTRLDLVNAVIDMRIAKARLDRAVEGP